MLAKLLDRALWAEAVMDALPCRLTRWWFVRCASTLRAAVYAGGVKSRLSATAPYDDRLQYSVLLGVGAQQLKAAMLNRPMKEWTEQELAAFMRRRG